MEAADSRMHDQELRAQIVLTARELRTRSLTAGTSGNVSARSGGTFLITPSGMPYQQMGPEDVVPVILHENGIAQDDVPSSEWQFHRDIYKSRPEVNAIVHAHPLYCTALACTRRDIPAFHYMVAAAGGKSIRCARYATFGTRDLSQNVLEALIDRQACLLANHGSLAVGADLESALHLMEELEWLASQYSEALKIGEPVLLTDAEMDEVLERFKTYGRAAHEARARGADEQVMWFGAYVPRKR
jgi:L-fuculose-phosphate aldolase